ncbi:class I SAM-dependent methyltransferase [Streptomyces sp. NBC_00648]|uniref:class I SAM-dependent methyltransferase n=1 Tax=Streptomyces sp. NBC_00648 TaxID=2975797 RepID=UPI003254FF76
MPTLVPEPHGSQGPSDAETHQLRQAAESFGSDAERYDRARPRYPDALVDRITAHTRGARVLDVGCGTGIVARQFQAAGCEVLGVEPDARMADVARRLGVEVEVAAFEAWDPGGREFDAVVAGQAWHWVDPAAGAAKASRVLRHGGRLAAFWNVFQLPPEVAEAFAAVYRRVLPDAPFNLKSLTKQPLDAYQGLFTKAVDGMRGAGAFSEPEQWRFDWEWSYSRDAWLDQVPTHGALTRLPPDKLAEVLEGIGAAIDMVGGGFTMRYATVAVTATRSGSIV